MKNDGTLNDICEISKIINERLSGNKIMAFLSYDILNNIIKLDDNAVLNTDIHNLTNIYNSRNYIEIEKNIYLTVLIFSKR